MTANSPYRPPDIRRLSVPESETASANGCYALPDCDWCATYKVRYCDRKQELTPRTLTLSERYIRKHEAEVWRHDDPMHPSHATHEDWCATVACEMTCDCHPVAPRGLTAQERADIDACDEDD